MPISFVVLRLLRFSAVAKSSCVAAIAAFLVCVQTAQSQPGVPPAPFTNPEEAREFARRNLPSGAKPGDILTDRPRFPEGDVAAIYRVVLDTLYTVGKQRPPFVVLYDLAGGRVVGCDKGICPFVPSHESAIDTLTLQDFRRATLVQRRIRPDFRYSLPISFMTREAQEKLTVIGESLPLNVRGRTSPAEHPFWRGFLSRYTGAWGITYVSQVGFNRARTEAMLQVRHNCGGSCGSMELMLLRKGDGRWRVVERMPESTEDFDQGYKDLRFRGVGARKPQAEIRAQAVADSIRNMAVPRAIRGTITNSATGAGIPLARITIHAGNTPNTPWTQAYSDASGKYVIVNPPVDGVGIMVRCPKTTRRPGDPLSVTGADIRPGSDTTIDFSVDLKMCDDPAETGLSPRPRGLTAPVPPLLTSAELVELRSATSHSVEEAGIYTTVLNGMWGSTPGEVTLVISKTRSLCATDCAARYNRRIRTVPQVILSTLENFLAVREKRLAIKPDFTAQSEFVSSYATRSDVQLIGDSALKYLELQSNFSASAYDATGQGHYRAYWDALHLAFPTVKGIVSFSPIGFSPRRKQALVEATRADINGFMSSDMFVLNNVNGEWRIAARF